AQQLSWVTRLRIAIEAAQALAFLHAMENQDFNPKLIGFGIDLVCNNGIHDITGYYHLSALSTHFWVPKYTGNMDAMTVKSDVYGFGVVLLQLLTGRLVYDRSRPLPESNLASWVRPYLTDKRRHKLIMDARLKDEYPSRGSFQVALLAQSCLAYHPQVRPSMEEVLEVLKNDFQTPSCPVDDVAVSSSRCFDSDLASLNPMSRPKLQKSWLVSASKGSQIANENADSSTEVEHTDSSSHNNVKIDEISRSGIASNRQSRRKPSKMTLIGRVRRFLLGSSRVIPAEEDLEDLPGQTRRFYLRELQVATDNFSNLNILAIGCSGEVYKGRLSDGSFVAVKRVITDCVGALMFGKHVEIISMALHPNIVPLIGYGMTQTERFLVYPLMVNGSVASCLRERLGSMRPLTWQIRKRIALGSARGLAYLHGHNEPNMLDMKILHRDVKAANILLNEKFEAVVGVPWVAKLKDNEYSDDVTAVCGTIGHIAPEYLSTGKCSEKSDVYGYGIMLLELLTGGRVFDLARLANDYDVSLVDWVKKLWKEKKLETLVDADLQSNYVEEEVEQLIQVNLLCTQDSPTKRPKMSEVVRMLEGDGLGERWEHLEHEILCPQFDTYHQNLDWIVADSTFDLRPEELSGPR
ncbi:hypothetical protein RJ639_009920, partial [Escallonia herrerae]